MRQTWEALIQTRTLVLDEMVARHSAGLGREAEGAGMVEASNALQDARQRLANLLVRGPGGDPTDRFRSLLRSARLEMERAERALGSKRPGPFRERSTRPGLQDVFDGLPSRWGLVAFASYSEGTRRRYVAFVRGSEGEPTTLAIGDAARIDALVHRWLSDLLADPSDAGSAAARAEARSRVSGRALRAAIWQPVRTVLGHVDGLIIVPDGSIHGVNFGALPTGSAGYLVEESPILHYVTSELDIAAAKSRLPRGAGLLAFGGVDFGVTGRGGASAKTDSNPHDGSEPDCEGFYAAKFEPLPQSRLEVEELSRIWNDSTGATVVVGPRATEETFKRLAPGKLVIHLATHGFFLDPNQCLQPAPGARGIGGLQFGVRRVEHSAFSEKSPLLLSGLALANANHRARAVSQEDDGILTAEEVASLDLRGVEWAVLSACDTGVAGSERSEGVLGLRRAFRTAGVATLVTSLWPVQDLPARLWMKALYKNRNRSGAGTARAVRAAMLEMLQSRRAQGRSTNPYFWAAFLAAGDWN